MNLWQKLTIDWPCAVGDWLWAALVVETAAFLDRLTWRRVLLVALQIAVFALLLMFIEQIIAFDLTFLFYIDVATFPDIIAAMFVVVAGGFAGRTLAAAARSLRPAIRSLSNELYRFGVRQRRNANALRRKAGSGAKRSEDKPAAWADGHYAFA